MEHDQVARAWRIHGDLTRPMSRPVRPTKRTQAPAAKGRARTNLTFLTGATNRLSSPIIERSFLGRCCRNGTQLNDFWCRRSGTAALETQFLKSHFPVGTFLPCAA